MKIDADALVFECALEAAPEQVWRALTIPVLLERWLRPAPGLELSVVNAEENRTLTYRWREQGQGAVLGAEESLVTFELTPTPEGGTWLTLTHAPLLAPAGANDNRRGPLMLAA
ncbi:MULTISPECIES: SRPBCC domain-containing protein [unclassified Devosia]|uniref:SRPBCC domain-containing protein n=1 Tax=unclassified Devosia TaxID=196773 RepID=UPI001557C4CC